MPHYLNSHGLTSYAAGACHVSAEMAETLRRPLWRLVRLVTTWNQRSRQRRQLRDLPPHLLEDIGVREVEARREATKPFWIA